MVEQLSPLGAAWEPGTHGNLAEAAGIRLCETRPGSIVEVAAWPGEEEAVVAAIGGATGLTLSAAPRAGAVAGTKSGFGIGPGKFLIVDEAEGAAEALTGAVTIESGTVCDLSHGRTAIRIEGAKAGWVLAKLFALDFSPAAFPVGEGRATAHHDIFCAIQRTGEDRFDLYVFRSFARSFWTLLCHAAAEVGYEVG